MWPNAMRLGGDHWLTAVATELRLAGDAPATVRTRSPSRRRIARRVHTEMARATLPAFGLLVLQFPYELECTLSTDVSATLWVDLVLQAFLDFRIRQKREEARLSDVGAVLEFRA